MPGLVRASASGARCVPERDGRDKPGHDGIKQSHAHPGHQRRRHPRAGAGGAASRSRASCPTTSGWWRRRPTNPASSHSLSLNDPLRLREVGDAAFRGAGTPTDCVIMAVRHICSRPQARPRAVRRQSRPERRRRRHLFRHGRRRHRGHAARHCRRSRCRRPTAPGGRDRPLGRRRRRTRPNSSAACSTPGYRAASLVNINFPDCRPTEVQGIAITAQGKRDQDMLRIEARLDGRGNPYYWIAFAGRGKPTTRPAPTWRRWRTSASR